MFVPVVYRGKTPVLKQHAGFTLIEIVIALLVISIALAAVISTTTNSVDSGAHLRNKTIALWVAQNYINDIVIHKKWPDTGKVKEQITMNNRSWLIRTDIIATANTNMRRMQVRVFFNVRDTEPLVSLTAYINHSSQTPPRS